MRTDGKFTVGGFIINSCKNHVPIKLMPFGDVHYDSPGFCEEKWREFCARAKSTGAYLLGMGDYMDAFSTSERTILGNPALHESTTQRQEKEAKRRIDHVADDLSFATGRIIGLLGGNHFCRFRDGTTSDQYLAGLLGCDYLGACAAIRLELQISRDSHHSKTVDIFAHHGTGGGGRTTGGKFHNVEHMSRVCRADIYLMGDNHARGCVPTGDTLEIAQKPQRGTYEIRARQTWLGRTGSFLRSYMTDIESYVVDRCLQPSSLGWIEFDLTMHRKQSSNGRHDEITLTITGTH